MAAGGFSGDKRTTRSSAINAGAVTTRSKAKKSDRKNHLKHQLVTLIETTISSAHSFLSLNDLHLLPSQTLALESFIYSTSSSLQALSPCLPKLSLHPPPRQCWFQRFLSATAEVDCDPRWNLFFRMSKSSFSLLLRLLSPIQSCSSTSVPPDCALAAALFRLAHGASYKAVGRRFGIDSADACRSFYAVCKAINDKLGHLLELRSDIDRIVVGFGWISLPNCCGVLGLRRFGVEGDLLGKDGSLLVQALVDAEGRFLDVSAGWPSSMKPETILRQSKLYAEIEKSGELLKGPVYNLDDGKPISQYLIGDSCFPLLPWLLTPYMKLNEEDSSGFPERAFNSTHNRAMGLVNTAFCKVRARWKLLSKPWKEECRDFFPFIVLTGCLLHNFLIKCSEKLVEEQDEDDGASCSSEEQKFPLYDGETGDDRGKDIRDALALHLSRLSFRR
ncbi:protein ALP1-like [Cucurbita pepo subsp. pepo]|uniref:protein ALP1-like n=1 Tax=Cucurbita pepo subsp. pepo TaxID=3664 RepID=UPI000C9D4A5A|nr:protein ALP1-like [Cucurbita pepo subsp. pepo]